MVAMDFKQVCGLIKVKKRKQKYTHTHFFCL